MENRVENNVAAAGRHYLAAMNAEAGQPPGAIR